MLTVLQSAARVPGRYDFQRRTKQISGTVEALKRRRAPSRGRPPPEVKSFSRVRKSLRMVHISSLEVSRMRTLSDILYRLGIHQTLGGRPTPGGGRRGKAQFFCLEALLIVPRGLNAERFPLSHVSANALNIMPKAAGLTSQW